MSELYRRTSDEQLVTREQDLIDRVHEYWSNIDLSDVRRTMPSSIEIDTGERKVRTAIVEPDKPDTDESLTLVMGLPFLNGWDEHHFIRAKVLQQIVAPESRVVVLPNNSFGQSAYDLTISDMNRLRSGSIRPIGEMHMRMLESMDSIGNVALTGYSQGAQNILGLASIESDAINVSAVNADEIPSKTYRTAKELQKDFMKSGGMLDLRRAVKESNIPALSQAMNFGRMAIGVAKFGLKSLQEESKATQQSMAGSASNYFLRAHLCGIGANQNIKVGSIEGSRVCDLDSIGNTGVMDRVLYQGDSFHGHASGDNVILHALMAKDGLIYSNQS